MPLYMITTQETLTRVYSVLAESPEEAKELLLEGIFETVCDDELNAFDVIDINEEEE